MSVLPEKTLATGSTPASLQTLWNIRGSILQLPNRCKIFSCAATRCASYLVVGGFGPFFSPYFLKSLSGLAFGDPRRFHRSGTSFILTIEQRFRYLFLD